MLSALILAGRCGSAMGAELGTMRVTEQIDALGVLATDPVHYLMVPRAWAATIMLPALVILANGIGIAGVLPSRSASSAPTRSPTWPTPSSSWTGTTRSSGLVKSAVFGLLIAIVGCQKGFYTTGGAEGVGRLTTRAVVLASITILVSDPFLTKLLY